MCDGVSVSDICRDVQTPVYIYSAKHFQKQYHDFYQALNSTLQQNILVAFAVKSCSNIAILKLLANMGAGADIVSQGEMRRALLAGIPADKIMFSGVGKTRAEIAFAIDNNIGVLNVESVSELNVIADISGKKNKIAPISLRINPDVVANTLPGISTGKKGDKFGIPIDIAADIYMQASDIKELHLKGLDFHIGSQVFDVTEFENAFVKMRQLVLDIRTKGGQITHLDCGGGLGVPYHPDETPPNLQDYADLVHRYFGDLELHFAFEPGRFIAGNAGIMASEILYEKSDSDGWNCLIIDAAMNDLVRPAMYGAYHHIVPVKNNTDHNDCKSYDIVGPVCESTDTFTKSYNLPVQTTGNLLAFLTAGAYGATMSSRYNTRPDIPEVLVIDNQYHIIRKRPDYDDMFRDEIF